VDPFLRYMLMNSSDVLLLLDLFILFLDSTLDTVNPLLKLETGDYQQSFFFLGDFL